MEKTKQTGSRVKHVSVTESLKPLVAALAASGLLPLPALSQETDEESLRTAPVVVTPTRVEQSAFDLPVSIDAFDQQQIQEQQPQVNLSEVLVKAPGVVANNRQNYAQDLQISIRGFGARSTFGVRGIRLYSDGIPLTMPDGQGQAANIDLSTAKTVEVLRGPFSALYGNSSGGVIAVFTEDGPEDLTVTPYASYGTFDTYRAGLEFGGTNENLNYIANAARFETDGYRDHSSARRDTFNGKLKSTLGDSSSLTLVMNYLDQPETQDPLGLTAAQVEQNPEQAGDLAVSQDTRKSITNAQTGLVYEHRLSDQDRLRMLGYVGDRQVTQFLSITSNGVVDLDRQFGGMDLRWTHDTQLGGSPVSFTIGMNYDRMKERRQAFANNAGQAGALGRDEDNTVYDFDQYVQAQWQFAEQWIASAGLRHSRVQFESQDFFITGGNPDDSGKRSFNNTTPVAGIVYKLSPTLNLYTSAGRGFETPTFAELAYSSTSTTTGGLNFTLQPAESANYELGVKALVGNGTRLNAALFYVDTKNEIVVQQNQGGRSVFQNVDKARRQGAELAIASDLGAGFALAASATYLDATFESSFLTCTPTPPCATPTVFVPAGNKIPGIPEKSAYAELQWTHAASRFSTALEAHYADKVFVNDSNSESADSYVVVNWRAGIKQELGDWRLAEFIRVDNVFDKDYIGSVIVNSAGSRYYEPAPGINFLVGFSASYVFR